jgi:hypothetical protein
MRATYGYNHTMYFAEIPRHSLARLVRIALPRCLQYRPGDSTSSNPDAVSADGSFAIADARDRSANARCPVPSYGLSTEDTP